MGLLYTDIKNQELHFQGIVFDDYVPKEEATGEEVTWSQICQSCVTDKDIDNYYLDDHAGHGYCGIKGCWNDADHYIDFTE